MPTAADAPDPPSDRWLVDKARAGDVGAYEVLIRRHRDRIHRLAVRMLGDHHDAEDVTQDVVIQLWTTLTSFVGASSFTTWLYRVVVNRCLNHRRRHPAVEITEDRHPTVPGPERHVLAGRELEAGLAAIAGLPDDLRVTLVLVQLEGLSYQEAAVITRSSEAAVRGRLHRARTALVRQMRAWS